MYFFFNNVSAVPQNTTEVLRSTKPENKSITLSVKTVNYITLPVKSNSASLSLALS